MLNDLVSALRWIGEMAIERPGHAVVFTVAAISLGVVAVTLSYGIAVYPAAIALGLVSGVAIGTIIYVGRYR